MITIELPVVLETTRPLAKGDIVTDAIPFGRVASARVTAVRRGLPPVVAIDFDTADAAEDFLIERGCSPMEAFEVVVDAVIESSNRRWE